MVRRRVGQWIPMPGTVGRVAIDEHTWGPIAHELNQCARLWAVQLDKVPVEIESLRILTAARLVRPHLSRPVHTRHSLVAVHVEVGNHEQCESSTNGIAG